MNAVEWCIRSESSQYMLLMCVSKMTSNPARYFPVSQNMTLLALSPLTFHVNADSWTAWLHATAMGPGPGPVADVPAPPGDGPVPEDSGPRKVGALPGGGTPAPAGPRPAYHGPPAGLLGIMAGCGLIHHIRWNPPELYLHPQRTHVSGGAPIQDLVLTRLLDANNKTLAHTDFTRCKDKCNRVVWEDQCGRI